MPVITLSENLPKRVIRTSLNKLQQTVSGKIQLPQVIELFVDISLR
jgi:hypothetical protein